MVHPHPKSIKGPKRKNQPTDHVPDRLEDLGDRRQKERTEEIVCMIEEYRKSEFPELTFNQILRSFFGKIVKEINKF